MRLIGFAFLIIFFFSCNSKEQNSLQSEAYFDIKGYFEKESDRLTRLNLTITKTVSIDGVKELKKIKIKDYKKELNTFIASDINKASWRGSFALKKEDDTILYTSDSEKVPVKRVKIFYKNNQLRAIQIVVKTNNILYHSSDTLNYFPDSLYEIHKTQKIRLLNEKKYSVTGRLK